MNQPTQEHFDKLVTSLERTEYFLLQCIEQSEWDQALKYSTLRNTIAGILNGSRFYYFRVDYSHKVFGRADDFTF